MPNNTARTVIQVGDRATSDYLGYRITGPVTLVTASVVWIEANGRWNAVRKGTVKHAEPRTA